MPDSIGSDNNSDKDNDFFMMILLSMNPASLCASIIRFILVEKRGLHQHHQEYVIHSAGTLTA